MLKSVTQSPSKNTPLYVATIVFIVLSLVFFPLLLLIIDVVVKNNERRVTENVIARSENILLSEVNRISGSLGDWSSWNDTYQFAQDENRDFVQNNMMDNTFSNLNINGMIILNSENEIIFDKFFDSEKQYSTASPIDFNILIDSHPKLISNNDQKGEEGFISHQGHIMIVASKPILSSFEEGPSKGSMIFLKLMDQPSLKEISSLALNKINLYTVSEIQQTIATFPDVTEMEEDVFFKIQGSESLLGFKYLKDIQSKPVIILGVENSRDLYKQGRTTQLFVSVILLILISGISWMSYKFTNSIALARQKEEEEERNKRLLEESRVNAIELEKKVLERTKALEWKNKEQQTFNYSVSHDLRSPLRGISGYASILLKEQASRLDESGFVYLNKIIETTKRMDDLINDLLAYTREEVLEEELSLVDLEEICESILHDYEKNHSNVRIQKNLECRNILVKRQSLKVVLLNLIDNAIKFTRDVGLPEIIISSTRLSESYLITIKDNGIGFNMDYQGKIFEIFQRLHFQEEYPGTGVGLALVKKAVDRLGGSVSVQSKIGEGTTFTVSIPAGKESQPTLLN